MRGFVDPMTWTREHVFRVMWPLALLCLPWQTRMFWQPEAVGILPVEATRWSLYASWIPMLLTILTGWRLGHPVVPTDPRKRHARQIGFSLLLLVSIVSVYIRATAQWWAEVLMLAAFVGTLWRVRVPAREVAGYVALSLLPHALFALRQVQTQMVWGTKWLGMAAQDPRWSGVSVVETTELRFLRAYGGFPHPNILGGWLAVVLPLVAWRADRGRLAEAMIWMVGGAALAASLVFSFSRAGWIAAFLAFILASATVYRRAVKPWGVAVLFTFAFIAGIVTVGMADLVSTRLQPASQRLERWSIEERTQSVKTGAQAIMDHPLLGTGPGTFVVVRSQETGSPQSAPPHVLPVLIWAEVGVLGMVGMILLGYGLLAPGWFARWRREGYPRLLALTPLSAVAVLSLFDHYLWSFWPGKALVAIAILFALLPLDEVE